MEGDWNDMLLILTSLVGLGALVLLYNRHPKPVSSLVKDLVWLVVKKKLGTPVKKPLGNDKK